ncbi:MAG: DUF3754 domain-containing protein [Hyphomicrobiaceae bacterium]|nr:DUF3754 domain-containing protein [Hyphomicrobiaceae bacterium]
MAADAKAMDTEAAPRGFFARLRGADAPAAAAPIEMEEGDVFSRDKEKFIPLTRHALIDRLTAPNLWHGNDAAHCRRFFNYLQFWRSNSYTVRLADLEQTYEPFSPDSDLLITRAFTPEERSTMQHRLVADTRTILEQANYTAIDPTDIALIMTKESHYGLDLELDMKAFEEILIYYRGSSTRTASRRSKKKFYLKQEEFELPIFRRLFLLFKLKPIDVRAKEVMVEEHVSREEADKLVRKRRGMLPPQISDNYVYMKLFKNIPRADIEMIFPNTRIRFRMKDKLKFGVTAGGGVGMGVIGTATKIAAATTPIGMAGAVMALGGIAARQATSFLNQRNKYMVTMAQNLYFHALADNRGVLTLLADRAAEEDVKEEFLLYCMLAKTRCNVRDLEQIDHAIERWLKTSFEADANYDVDDALKRLIADGIVTQLPDGTLETLSPAAACERIDHIWDNFLNHLPGLHHEGHEADPDDEQLAKA